jgi:hypothetical protein
MKINPGVSLVGSLITGRANHVVFFLFINYTLVQYSSMISCAGVGLVNPFSTIGCLYKYKDIIESHIWPGLLRVKLSFLKFGYFYLNNEKQI